MVEAADVNGNVFDLRFADAHLPQEPIDDLELPVAPDPLGEASPRDRADPQPLRLPIDPRPQIGAGGFSLRARALEARP